MGWMTGGTTTRRPPPRLRAAARRVVRVLLAASPHLPQWIRRTTHHLPQPHEPLLVGWITGGTTMQAAPRIEQRTTRPQPHEPLLVGWITGGTRWRLEATTAHCYSTHNHCHEPLLVGGKGCYARGGAWQGVFPLESSGITGFWGVLSE